jgi:hypothetical protein
MYRSWQLRCALASFLIACGSAKDADLYGDTSPVQGSGGGTVTPSGGKESSGGDEQAGSNAGEPANTGGDSGPDSNGGSSAGETGGAEPGAGGDPSASAGQGDGSSTGGTDTGSGGSSGGVASGGSNDPSGGAPPDGGAAPGGGTATGGTSTGGVAIGGAASGGKLGTGGESTCQDARQAMAEALEAAQACEPNATDQCLGHVNGECCPVPVNDPASPEATAFSAAVTKVHKVCGLSICPAVLCLEPSDASCESRGQGSGHCVARGAIDF